MAEKNNILSDEDALNALDELPILSDEEALDALDELDVLDEESDKKKVQTEEDMESVSETGSSDSQEPRGDDTGALEDVDFSVGEVEEGVSLMPSGEPEIVDAPEVLPEAQYDPTIPLSEKEQLNYTKEELAQREKDAEVFRKSLAKEFVDRLPWNFDYLSANTSDISDMLPAEVDDNWAFQEIEKKKNEAVDMIGKDYYYTTFKDSVKTKTDKGMPLDEAEDLVARKYLDSLRDKGITSLGLDDDELTQYRSDIKEYYELRKIPFKERTEEQKIRVKDLDRSIGELRELSEKFFINPDTGEVDGEKKKIVDSLTSKYQSEVKSDFQKFTDRYKKEYDNLNGLDVAIKDAYFNDKVDVAKEDGIYDKISVEDIEKMSAQGVLPEGADIGKVNALISEKEKGDLEFYALSRALLLNEDPSAVERGFGNLEGTWLEDVPILTNLIEGTGQMLTSAGESAYETWTGNEFNSDKDYREAIVDIAQQEGVRLTEDQLESGKSEFSERLGDTFGVSSKIMADIIVNTLIAKKASSFLKIPSHIAKLKALKDSPKLARLADKTYEALTQAIAFEFAEGGSAAMGAGEFLGAEGMERLLSKMSGGKMGKLLTLFGRIAGATTAGTVEEYAGEFVDQGFKNGFFTEETFKNTFGRDYDEALDKLLLTSAMTLVMGTGAEVGKVTSDAKKYYADLGDTQRMGEIEAIIEANKLAEKAKNEAKNLPEEYRDSSLPGLRKKIEEEAQEFPTGQEQRRDRRKAERLAEKQAELESKKQMLAAKAKESGEVDETLLNEVTELKEEVAKIEAEEEVEEKVEEEELEIRDEDIESIEDEIAEAEGDTFENNIGETVTYNGVTGVLKQEGQTLVVESRNKVQELGNAKEIMGKPMSSMNVEPGGELEAEPVDVTKDVPTDLTTTIDGVPHRIVNARTRKGEPYVTVKNLETGLQKKITGEEGKALLDQFNAYKGKRAGEIEVEAKARTEEEFNALSEEQKAKEAEEFDALVEEEVKAEEELASEMKAEEDLESTLKKKEKEITDEAEALKAEAEKELEAEVKKLRKSALVISNKKGDFLVRQKPDGSHAVSKKNIDSGKYVPFAGKSNADQRAKVIEQFKKEMSKAESTKIDEAAELSESIEKDKRDMIEKALDWAINVSSMKGDKAFNNVLAIPVNIAHGGLRIVKSAYKSGKSLSQAIQQGINSIKSQGYNVNEVEFKKYVLNEIKEGNKKAKKEAEKKKKEEGKKKREGETKVEKSKREREESSKRDQDLDKELEVLVEEALNTEASKTKKDVAKLQKKFKDFISSNKKVLRDASPALNATIANKLAGINSPATLKSAAEYVSKIIKDKKFKKEQEVRAKKLDNLKNELNPENWKRKGTTTAQGKFDIEVQDTLKEANKASGMSKLDASKARDKILSTYKPGEEISESDQAKLDGLMFADLENVTDLQLDILTEKVKQLKKEGREDQRARKLERKQKYQQGQEQAINAVTRNKPGSVPTTNELRSSARKLSTKIKDAVKLKGILRSLRQGISYNENWSGLMNQVNRLRGEDVGSKEKAANFMKERFVDPVNKAESDKMRSMRSTIKKVRAKKQSVFGNNLAKTNKLLQKPVRVRDAAGNVFTDKNGRDLVLTRDQAMNIYNITQDPSLEPTLKEMKKNPGEKAMIEQAVAMVKSDGRLKEYADWVRNDFYPEYYKRVNQEYRKQYDYDLPFNPNYTPIRRLKGSEPNIDVLSPQFNIASTLNGSLKERVDNKNSIDLSGGIEGNMVRYADQMEHFINFTDVIKDLSQVFSNQDVKNAIEYEVGKPMNNIIEKFIQDLTNKPESNSKAARVLQGLRKNYTTAVLGLNPTVFLKQLTSAPAYAVATGVDVSSYLKNSAKLYTTRKGRKALKEIRNSDFIQDRKENLGFDRDTALSLEKDLDQLMSGTSSLKNRLMFMTKEGDIRAIITGGTPYYMSMKDKYMKQGMSESKASEKALLDFENTTKSTQQSSSVTELSDLQRSGEMMKLFTMFKTSPAQYFRKTSSSYRNLMRGRGTAQDVKNIAMFQVILPSLFTAASKAFTFEDDDLSDYEDSVLVGNLQGIPFVGELLKLYLDKRSGKPFDYEAFPAMAGLVKAVESSAEMMSKGSFDYEDLINDVLVPTLESTTGLPIKNAKKLTLDNFKRIGSGRINSYKDVMKMLGYSDYALDRNLFKKSKSGSDFDDDFFTEDFDDDFDTEDFE